MNTTNRLQSGRFSYPVSVMVLMAIMVVNLILSRGLYFWNLWPVLFLFGVVYFTRGGNVWQRRAADEIELLVPLILVSALNRKNSIVGKVSLSPYVINFVRMYRVTILMVACIFVVPGLVYIYVVCILFLVDRDLSIYYFQVFDSIFGDVVWISGGYESQLQNLVSKGNFDIAALLKHSIQSGFIICGILLISMSIYSLLIGRIFGSIVLSQNGSAIEVKKSIYKDDSIYMVLLRSLTSFSFGVVLYNTGFHEIYPSHGSGGRRMESLEWFFTVQFSNNIFALSHLYTVTIFFITFGALTFFFDVGVRSVASRSTNQSRRLR